MNIGGFARLKACASRLRRSPETEGSGGVL
jgi:hypothetical protein